MWLQKIDESNLSKMNTRLLSSFDGASIGVKVKHFLYEMFPNLQEIKKAKLSGYNNFEELFENVSPSLKDAEKFLTTNIEISFFKEASEVNKIYILSRESLINKEKGFAEKSENYEDMKLIFYKKLHNEFIDCLKDVYAFTVKGSDPYFRMRQYKFENVPAMLSNIKNKIFTKIFKFDDFVKMVDPIFEEKLNRALNKKILNVPFLDKNEMYLVKSNLTFDDMMNGEVPEILKFHTFEMKINPENEHLEVFIKSVNDGNDVYSLSQKKESYKIKLYDRYISFYYRNQETYCLYFDKESAKKHYTNKFDKIKKDIEKIEKKLSRSIASF